MVCIDLFVLLGVVCLMDFFDLVDFIGSGGLDRFAGFGGCCGFGGILQI